ncbi:hypothetical protein [Bacillus sp. 7894-2]|uniref:hypothetical protein n=1 Tax=Bacillus sp. 7894-2 TaxID=2021695 RepID=UPI0015CDF7F9|nr:hypothetical protein [Bacillus sp. 7894-2]
MNEKQREHLLTLLELSLREIRRLQAIRKSQLNELEREEDMTLLAIKDLESKREGI